MSTESKHGLTVFARLDYWWAGLLMLRSQCETRRIVWRGHWRWIQRQRCKNGRERIRERSASTI